MGRSLLAWGGLTVLVVLAVVTAGWGNSPGTRPARTPAPDPASLVRKVDLDATDLSTGFREVTARDGTDLDVGDRLALCGAAVPAEGFRLAAHRRAFVAPGHRRIRTEVVAYRRGHGERALDELRDAAPTCARPVPPEPVEQPGTLALRVRGFDPVAGSVRELVVERRGDVIVLLEVDGRRGDVRRGRLALDLARVLSSRLESELPDR
jgi:hypothetical protein